MTLGLFCQSPDSSNSNNYYEKVQSTYMNIYIYRQPVGSVGGALDYCAGDRGSIPGRTNTRGLKITEEKVLPL